MCKPRQESNGAGEATVVKSAPLVCMKMCSPGEQRPFTWKKNDIEKMKKLKHQHQSEILKDVKQWKVMKSNKSRNIRSHHSYMLCICDWSWLDRKQNASRSKSSLPGPDRSNIGTQVIMFCSSGPFWCSAGFFCGEKMCEGCCLAPLASYQTQTSGYLCN